MYQSTVAIITFGHLNVGIRFISFFLFFELLQLCMAQNESGDLPIIDRSQPCKVISQKRKDMDVVFRANIFFCVRNEPLIQNDLSSFSSLMTISALTIIESIIKINSTCWEIFGCEYASQQLTYSPKIYCSFASEFIGITAHF